MVLTSCSTPSGLGIWELMMQTGDFSLLPALNILPNKLYFPQENRNGIYVTICMLSCYLHTLDFLISNLHALTYKCIACNP